MGKFIMTLKIFENGPNMQKWDFIAKHEMYNDIVSIILFIEKLFGTYINARIDVELYKDPEIDWEKIWINIGYPEKSISVASALKYDDIICTFIFNNQLKSVLTGRLNFHSYFLPEEYSDIKDC
jgi:hypothetical protein